MLLTNPNPPAHSEHSSNSDSAAMSNYELAAEEFKEKIYDDDKLGSPKPSKDETPPQPDGLDIEEIGDGEKMRCLS
jgi:hypothetical protein